jgi:hypothetical protein
LRERRSFPLPAFEPGVPAGSVSAYHSANFDFSKANFQTIILTGSAPLVEPTDNQNLR